MFWQDFIIGIGQWFFAASIIPSIISRNKPSVWTSLPTAILLLIFSYAHFTLGLYCSMVSSIVVSTMWVILFIQKTNGDMK